MHRVVLKRAAPPGPVKKAVPDAPTTGAAASPALPAGLLGSAPQPHAGDKRQRDEPGATTSAQVAAPLGGGADAPAADEESDEVRKRRERLAAWRAKQQASKPAPPGPDSAAAVGAPALRVQPSTGPKVAAVAHGTGLLPLGARPPQAAPAPPPRKGIALVKAPVVRVKSALQSLDDDAAAAGPPVKPLPVPASALEATAEAVAAFAAAAAAASAGGADGRRASRWASNPPSAVDLLEAYPSRSGGPAAAAADEQADDFDAYLRSIGAETAGPGVLGEGAAPGVMTAEELEALLAGVDESAPPPQPESDDEEEEDDAMAGPGSGEAAAPDAAPGATAPAPDAPLTSAQIKKAKRARAKARAEADAATAAAAAAAAISSGSMPAPVGEDFDDITGAAERAAELAAAAALADGSAPPPAPAADPAADAADEGAAAAAGGAAAEEDEETSLFKGEEWEGPTRSALDQVRQSTRCFAICLPLYTLPFPPRPAQLRDKIAKKDLKAVDHAAVQYAPFRKALYIESR